MTFRDLLKEASFEKVISFKKEADVEDASYEITYLDEFEMDEDAYQVDKRDKKIIVWDKKYFDMFQKVIKAQKYSVKIN